jgi:telomerase reverse transcriptase
LARVLAESLSNAILVDNVVYAFESRDELVRLLEHHITNNLIRVNQSFAEVHSQIGETLYRQTIGIPQGSILSTLLCSLFYGHLESKKLAVVQSDPNAVLSCV